MNCYSEYVKKILTSSVYDVAQQTPLVYAKNLSERLENCIYMKREDLQPVFSFKLRGAYNRISQLSKEEASHGVITASAGNHAQGVALGAQKLGYSAIIVMPITTPQIKIDAVKHFGANVVLHGNSFSDAYQHALQLIEKNNMIYIPPFDDEYVIAGQGTIAMEIISQYPKKIDAIFIPIGGGGLAAGIATFTKNVRPDIKVIGVQTEDSCAMKQSIDQNKIVSLKSVGLFADGTAVKEVGKITYQICRDLLDDIILVDTDAICAAIKDIFNETRSIIEPSGALGLAGLKSYIIDNNIKNQTLITINSGANINFHRLRHVSERTELTEKKEIILAVTIPEKAGSFLKFIQVIGNRNITEFNYRYGNRNNAHIFVGIETNSQEDIQEITQSLTRSGFATLDLSDNEIAKIHIRHMVGGKTNEVKNEQLFSFEFPEYPNALGHFLSAFQSKWNITLFHYRNHGSDYGRVIMGIDVPPQDKEEFRQFINKLDYEFLDHTHDPAYELFLSPF
ncbi:MAG: threonine ammonia-lyase, biosynthetic [Neisseriaceae bacterium]|nr:MAG: threonine ammonia-lyase, biosynthetic [Neisseriaceae bacterium]